MLIPFAAYVSGYEPAGATAGAGDSGISVEISGHGSILGRNLASAADAVRSAGAECVTTNGGYLPFTVSGSISAHKIVIDGKASSQIVSGMLMTLPLLGENTILQVDNPASIPYIDLTLDVLAKFGIEINRMVMTNGSLVFYIEGAQQYLPCELYMEPDWSSASFFAVAYAISSMLKGGCTYTLLNMPVGTAQADEAILKVLKLAGVQVDVVPSGYSYDVEISAPQPLMGFEFDATDAPDLFPVLAVLASYCKGVSTVKGVNRLLQKESNRAESIFTEFVSLGADISINDDVMYINGIGDDGMPRLKGGNVHSHNDHRIAMSVIVTSLFAEGEITLDEVKCIDKSFPTFLNRFNEI